MRVVWVSRGHTRVSKRYHILWGVVQIDLCLRHDQRLVLTTCLVRETRSSILESSNYMIRQYTMRGSVRSASDVWRVRVKPEWSRHNTSRPGFHFRKQLCGTSLTPIRKSKVYSDFQPKGTLGLFYSICVSFGFRACMSLAQRDMGSPGNVSIDTPKKQDIHFILISLATSNST